MDAALLSRIASATAARSSTLDLSGCGMRAFPEGLDASTLRTFQTINAANNPLSALTGDTDALQDARTLFFLGCEFQNAPRLEHLPALRMLSFKSQRGGGLRVVPDNALPHHLLWLILTDNALVSLPSRLGTLAALRKLMLASNGLTSLPDMSGCVSLELLRLSDNQLGEAALAPPAMHHLLSLPRLAWLGLAGNAWGPHARVEGDNDPASPHCALPRATRASMGEGEGAARITVGALLGTGASGNVHEATLSSRRVAVKLFRGSSSDGRALDEAVLCTSLAAHPHPHLVHAEGWAHGTPRDGAGAPLSTTPMLATVMPLHVGVRPLAKPPSFSTVTRDVYEGEGEGEARHAYTPSFVLHVLTAVASAMAHLHSRGVCHGDLYAHNVLVDPPTHLDGGARGEGQGRVLLSDLGAGFAYDVEAYGTAFQQVEVAAYGCLVEELGERVATSTGGGGTSAPHPLQHALAALAEACRCGVVSERPLFVDVLRQLEGLR